MNIPKIIVIDDYFGRNVQERRDLCKSYKIHDVTGDDPEPFINDSPIAEGLFSSAQLIKGNEIENHISIAIDDVRKGWPNKKGEHWALCLLDLRFTSGLIGDNGQPSGKKQDDNFGLLILKELRAQFPDLPIIILTSRKRSTVHTLCRQFGASGFMQRYDNTSKQAPHELLKQNLHEFGLFEDPSDIVIGRSLEWLKLLAKARRKATGSGPILLLGMTGTGKEMLARYIHENSPSSKGPYKILKVHNTAETLQDDLLFGHEIGAFDGATSLRKGIFEEANGGTLFIDEIGDIPESLQNKLMRPIEERVVNRQGNNSQGKTPDIPISVQIILATNKDLDEYARTGSFKSDLLNRIDSRLTLPLLNQRREDIPLIAKNLLEKQCKIINARAKTLDDKAMNRLVEHDWVEGNVRELRNVLQNAVENYKDSEILLDSDLKIIPFDKTTPEPESNIKTSDPSTSQYTLTEFLNVMDHIYVDSTADDFNGIIPRLEEAFNTLSRILTGAALERYSDGNKFIRSLSMGLLAGDASLTTGQANRDISTIIGKVQTQKATESELKQLVEEWKNYKAQLKPK